jgi:hypothetical protein
VPEDTLWNDICEHCRKACRAVHCHDCNLVMHPKCMPGWTSRKPFHPPWEQTAAGDWHCNECHADMVRRNDKRAPLLPYSFDYKEELGPQGDNEDAHVNKRVRNEAGWARNNKPPPVRAPRRPCTSR